MALSGPRVLTFSPDRVIRILPLGGAGEVGASCALLEIDDIRLLIDAGVRVGGSLRRTGQSLPDFSKLSGVRPQAMLVTHAHMDHVGALPLAPDVLAPGACIHMTTPTLHLLQVLQGDTTGSGPSDATEDGSDELKPWTSERVDQMLSRCIPHPFHRPFYPIAGRTDVVVEFGPNGHVLGSAWMLIDTPSARVLWLGDYSVTPQPTIGGLDVEALVARVADRRVDVVLTEGTYGVSHHPARTEETLRFLKVLAKVADRGGMTLIPAFALGRAQDLVQTIRQAKLQGYLHDVPVLLDGMVQPITQVYQNIAHHAYPHLQVAGGPETPLTLLDPELQILRATAPVRTRILKGEHQGPAVIIASSGMLIGGKSVLYAKALAQHEKHAILLSGYQDEESPGRKLMGMRRGKKLQFADGEKVNIKCSFGRYHISAHADGTQILDLIARVNPRRVCLVHGEPESLEALKAVAGDSATVLTNGEEWTFHPRTKLRPLTACVAVSAPPMGQVANVQQVRELWTRISSQGIREYSDREVALQVFGPGYSSRQLAALDRWMTDDRLHFHTGAKIGERTYRPRSVDELQDLYLERQAAWMMPVHEGDVVVWCDGGAELQIGIIGATDANEVHGVVAGSDRDRFQRAWIRGASLIGRADLEAQGMRAMGAVRWLERTVREARHLDSPDVMHLWAWAEKQSGTVTTEDCIRSVGHDPMLLTAAERLQWMLVLAGARGWFSLAQDGTWVARSSSQVAAHRQGARLLAVIDALKENTTVRLQSGTAVHLEAGWSSRGFRVKGDAAPWAWRHLLLSGEDPIVPVRLDQILPPTVEESSRLVRRRSKKKLQRQRRRQQDATKRDAEIGRDTIDRRPSVIPSEIGSEMPKKRRRRRRSRRRSGEKRHDASQVDVVPAGQNGPIKEEGVAKIYAEPVRMAGPHESPKVTSEISGAVPRRVKKQKSGTQKYPSQEETRSLNEERIQGESFDLRNKSTELEPLPQAGKEIISTTRAEAAQTSRQANAMGKTSRGGKPRVARRELDSQNEPIALENANAIVLASGVSIEELASPLPGKRTGKESRASSTRKKNPRTLLAPHSIDPEHDDSPYRKDDND